MDSSRQTSRAHQRNQEHPQQSSYHPNVHQNASPDPDAHPDFEPDQSDEEEDSFDVTSLVPSTSNSIIQSGSVEGHTLERTGAYDTFLHTNQDHTGHLRQLNDLIPSPAAVKAHVERVSHSTINSSTFESHTAMSSMRMHIPREGVPITLHEETSEELRRSELSNNLYPTALDFQGSSDEDDCSTVHAPQGDTNRTFYSITGAIHSNDRQATHVTDGSQTGQEETSLEASDERSDSSPQHYPTAPENRRHAITQSRTCTPSGPARSETRAIGTPVAKSPFTNRFHDDSVYLTPEASLIVDNPGQPVDIESKAQTLVSHDHQLSQDFDDDKSCSAVIPTSSSAWEANLSSRYRILLSLAENLKQDLSIKDQVIRVLKTDRDQAYKDRDESERKMKEMTDKLQEAVMQQKTKQDQQAQRIASIVENLSSEIENLRMKCEINSAENTKMFSREDVHQFQTQLQSSKIAMQEIQQLPGNFKTSVAELQLLNLEQAEKISTDEKEIAMLRQQVQQLQRQVTSSPQLAVTERSTTGRLSPTSKDSRANDRESKVVHEREVSRMKIEIESLSKQLAMVSVKDQDLKHVKKNVRTLEEDAKTRMEVMAKLRAESHSLQHELKLTKKALKSAEDGQADALEQINRLQQRLDSISQERLSESQANLVKLTESRNGFNADLSELMSKLKASFQEAEQLRVELERSKSETCKACEAKEIRTTVLQEERNSLQTQLDDCRAQAADKEVQIDRLRKIRKELKSDIEGLNIALEAKQHENSYLKRDRHVREAGLTSSSLATSTRTRSNRTSIHLGSRTVTEGTINLEKSGHPILKPEHHNPRKSILENRTMLSSITNTSKRAVRPSSSESVSAVPSIPTLARKSLDRKSSSIALSRRGKYSQQKEEECLPVNAQQPLHAEEKKSENPKNTFRVCQT
ncbi:hypothetical protein PTTG_11993 [Puccinia triticina 1-1 BBBD Race 1]|uniref:Uncharacterized protein n=1 Tax=Puccinia triticina (isolate 1-1 / race 1 (BBBD)) TaxID=630390 RepID=A0A180GNZ1_PUCT1|nr:hypothetical protein PTTG_11993 [Puccinia triticina 1-1 BBBD Race 1]